MSLSIQKVSQKLLVALFVSILLIFSLTVCASAYTVTTSGINTVYTLDYDKSFLFASITSTGNAYQPLATVVIPGQTYDVNGGVNTSSLTMVGNYDASYDNINRVNCFVSPYNDRSTSPGFLTIQLPTEDLDFSFTNSVDITLTSTSIISPSRTDYSAPLIIYDNNLNYLTIYPSYTVFREFSNGFQGIEVHYLLEHDEDSDPLVISRILTTTFLDFRLDGLDAQSYNRYRFTLNNVQITELAKQSVQDYYTAIQAGNDDMKQFFGTINTVDSSKISNQTNVNDQLSSTVGDYTSTSDELPDFDFGEDFYIPSFDLESDAGATSDLWDLIFGSATEGGSTSLGLFLKRVFSVITVIAVISLVISGIPNVIRFRGD